MRWTVPCLAIGLLACAAQAFAQSPPAYKVVAKVPLGAPDKWDYVAFDGPSHRVFVAHGDRLTVVDSGDGKMLGEVTGITGGTHGIGLSYATGKGYTDDGKGGLAVVFDLKTLKTLKTVPAKPDADGIAFDPVSGHMFIVDGDSKVITVLDPATDAVIATINGGGGLEFGVSGLNGKLYVNGADNREIVRIDTATNTVDAHWPTPGCESPHGLAIDTDAHRLFTTCVNKLMTILNTDTGAVIAALPIGRGTDAAAFDPKRKLAFSSNGEGTITVIKEVDPMTFVSLGAIKTAATGRTMSIDPDTGRLYVAAAEVDTKTPVPAGGRPKLVPGSLKLIMLDPVAP